MSVLTIEPEAEVSKSRPRTECRVYERHPSDLQTQCQPLAARGDNEINWPATVRDISMGGVGLVLRRRFEPRTGLAIELPDGTDSTHTVFVRVIHARAQPDGGWLLGCCFVSPITEERLGTLLHASGKKALPQPPESVALPSPLEAAPARPRAVITGVHFRAQLPDGSVLSRSVSRLHMTGSWPLAAGRIVRVWAGKGRRKGDEVAMRVNDCHQEGDQWFVDCSFVDSPPVELIRKLHVNGSKTVR